VIEVAARAVVADIPVPGRTRWTIVDRASHACYVNIADPSQIVVIDADTLRVSRVIPIPAAGPHGLDADVERRRLFCACDGGSLVEVDLDSAEIIRTVDLTGAPDVIFFNSRVRHLYVAVGDPGVIEVFDTAQLRRVERVPTERWDGHRDRNVADPPCAVPLQITSFEYRRSPDRRTRLRSRPSSTTRPTRQ
jgi:DNA-binding beta-propeller fold protein YncE